jgi:hypothetical protein
VVFAALARRADLFAKLGHDVELAAALFAVEAANLRVGEHEFNQRSA